MDHAFSGIVVRYCGDAGRPIPTTNPSSLEDSLHVNLWEVGESPFLDLGVMVNNWREVSAIQVDLPWIVATDSISDLGSHLKSERPIAAIFNELVQYVGYDDRNYAIVSFRPSHYAGSDPGDGASHGKFALLRLDKSCYATTTQVDQNTTRIRIELPRGQQAVDPNVPRVYVRFRVRNVPESMYVSVFSQADKNLLSSSIETRIIDFRINVRRGVPTAVLATSDPVWFPQFKKIHFFLTIVRSQICELESQNFVGCRSLFDEEVWNDYIELGSLQNVEGMRGVSNYLGYQWTASAARGAPDGKPVEGVKDLVVLGRFSRVRSSWVYILRFVVLGLIFGMIGNGLWDVMRPKSTSVWPALALLALSGLVAGALCWPSARARVVGGPRRG